MAFDVEKVRARYPALSDGRSWLDSAGGTQVPQQVIDAVAEVLARGVSNVGGDFDSSRRAVSVVAGARAALADLTGAPGPECVVFGPSTTALVYRFAGVLAAGWRPGDEVVVTELDHDSNVRPWVQHAQRAGATVRFAPIDPETGSLPAERVVELIGERTRLVAVTAASNLVGEVPDVAAITRRAREVGATSFVDGVQHCPHAEVDVAALGADFYATSAYKWSGPHLAAVVAADPWSLETLNPDKLLPSPDEIPTRFELGTAPFESLAGVTAAVDHLAELDPAATGTRRERLLASRRAVVAHEDRLAALLFDGLAELPHVRRVGRPTGRCTPIAAFTVPGRSPAEVAGWLAERGINVSAGHGYAWQAVRALGLGEEGAVRAALCHYSEEADVRRLLDALGELA
ncbi:MULTISPECIES: cysteine desulfurase-like protein [unclassified Saccharopolyspora]|uniref:cysteine desulfurase-like protein n=1 Tax=unclassified Saccharopolyspora TaxID=2646250 RepID=UPI001CD4E21E|nr:MULTISPECIES: cysteine desulfurase-like protein [unclassified Saccharopolyspora]MCA1186095.1 cysteine desulfurase-like protein [Saccharopolyspora sp. 6T]MCA1193145.1 cysteine desulfurase-like protein [Saccharopolyspora sp. 6V]MCA1224550.1 cysteine desulfurase-like protein [Saccharopolyspora sp. 6M]MCA1279021.1 cysteine desulfurase-like protein [Saccharopolyspora sp. 7B]